MVSQILDTATALRGGEHEWMPPTRTGLETENRKSFSHPSPNCSLTHAGGEPIMTQQHHDVAAFLAAAGVRTNPAVPGHPLAAGPDAACWQKFCHFEEGGLHCESSRLPSAGVDMCRLLNAACMPHGAPGCRKRENNGLEVPSLSEFNDSTPLILSTPLTPSTH